MIEFDREAENDETLDRELRTALHPIAAPDGFSGRVLARARQLKEPNRPALTLRRSGIHPTFRWSVAALLLLAMAFGGILEHRHQRRIAGEHARDQVLLALRITSATLHAVRNQVNRNSTNQ